MSVLSALSVSDLPHRAPFILVDNVIAGEEGGWIRATRALPRQDPLLTEEGTLPAPLLIEAIAQATTLLLLAARPRGFPVLLGIETATFDRQAARAGDVLYVYAEVCWIRRRFGKARGRVSLGTGELANVLLCEAEFTFGWKFPGEP